MPQRWKRSRKTFSYGKDRKKSWKKKKEPKRMKNEVIREHWDKKQSLKANFKALGLSNNPNETIPIPKTDLMELEVDDIEKYRTRPSSPTPVLKSLEAISQIPKTLKVTVTGEDRLFAQTMLKEHGDNIHAMVMDDRNVLQRTEAQMKRLISKYRTTQAV